MSDYVGPTTDGADALRDAARKQNGYKSEVVDSSIDDATRLNSNANFTWTPSKNPQA